VGRTRVSNRKKRLFAVLLLLLSERVVTGFLSDDTAGVCVTVPEYEGYISIKERGI
jgi:hypothetical protein